MAVPEAPLAGSASKAHCGQLGRERRFLADKQSPGGWQGSVKSVEAGDIKRRMVLEQLESRVCACRQAAGHPMVGDCGSQGCQQEQGGTSTFHGARAGSSRVPTRQKGKEEPTMGLPT